MAGSEIEPANSSSGEEEEEASSEGSESEFDTPQLPDPNTKPVSSSTPRSKNPVSRYSPPPLKQPTGKRPATDGESSDVKRIKNNNNNTTEMTSPMASPDANNGGEKKQLFQRLWSEDNEIELIQGMISYVEEKGKDPVADVNDFHEFVKESLHVDVNDRQMLAKARRLKKKFLNNVARLENQAKVRTLSNPHEKRMYELSKILWGDGSNKKAVMNACSKKVKVKVNVTPKTNKSFKPDGNGDVGIEVRPNEVEVKTVQPPLLRPVGSLGIAVTDEGIMNKGLELVSGAKKVEMEEKWKSLKMLELEHFMKKMDVLKEQAEVVFNAIANSVAK